jgi:hypothetical protein
LIKIKHFFNQGGKVIATTLLPSKSAEFGLDTAIQKIIKEIFAIDPERPMPGIANGIRTNAKGGMSLFIPKVGEHSLAEALNKMETHPDVIFENNSQPNSGDGAFSYIHKIKNGKSIYYFANSTNDSVHTNVGLRGRIKADLWDPNTGEKSLLKDIAFKKINGITYTRIKLTLDPVKSVFVVER